MWFVSHCNAHSGRDKLVSFMQENIGVDVYGKCGPYKESQIKLLLNYDTHIYIYIYCR